MGGAGGAGKTFASTVTLASTRMTALSVPERRVLSMESMRERPEVFGDLGLDLGCPPDEFVVVVPEGALGADCALASDARSGGDGSRGSNSASGAAAGAG